MTTKIKVNTNGSIRIEGDFELLDGSGTPYNLNGRTSVSLCRCGHTENKPFCDGAHARCSFESQVTATTLPAPKK